MSNVGLRALLKGPTAVQILSCTDLIMATPGLTLMYFSNKARGCPLFKPNTPMDRLYLRQKEQQEQAA